MNIHQMHTIESFEKANNDHSALMKMLDSNNAAICKWLKTDYKLDLSKLSQLGDTLNSIVEQQTTKKHEGPHCCTMCDRKFVHASGLSRHMDKHDSGNTLSAAMTHDAGAASSLETAIKCTKCSRVFRRVEDCLEHLLGGHEVNQSLANTIDFSDDDDDELESMEDNGCDSAIVHEEVV